MFCLSRVLKGLLTIVFFVSFDLSRVGACLIAVVGLLFGNLLCPLHLTHSSLFFLSPFQGVH